MSRRREEKNGSSELELEDYAYRYYKDLRDKLVRIRVSDKIYRCPYCCDRKRKEYDYREILRHASRIGEDSKGSRFRDRARHLGIVKYLERYVDPKVKSSRSARETIEAVAAYTDGKRKSSTLSRKANESERGHKDGKSSSLRSPSRTSKHPETNINVKGIVEQSVARTSELLERYADSVGTSLQTTSKDFEIVKKIDKKSIPLQATARKTIELSKGKAPEELLVWPWMAIVANIPVEHKDGRYVGDSGKKLKEEWATQGYNPVKVHPLWNYRGHLGYAIVEFNKDWAGFHSAMMFEKAFEMEDHGKRSWYASRHKGDKLYAWIARDEEYNSKGLIGEYLCKNGDLKMVGDIEEEDRRKDTKHNRSYCKN